MHNYFLVLISTPFLLQIVLFNNQKMVEKVVCNLNQNFKEKFFPNLKKILEKQKILLVNVKEIYATVGPGSYTSDRIICTFLRTLKVLQPSVKIFTINSLFWLCGKNKKVLASIYANKKEIYLLGSETGKITLPMQKIFKKELPFWLKKYSSSEYRDELFVFDFVKHFQSMKSCFKIVNDYKNILPIIKN